jgi:hypothetical protein
VSIGPFHKAFGTAICQGNIHFREIYISTNLFAILAK